MRSLYAVGVLILVLSSSTKAQTITSSEQAIEPAWTAPFPEATSTLLTPQRSGCVLSPLSGMIYVEEATLSPDKHSKKSVIQQNVKD